MQKPCFTLFIYFCFCETARQLGSLDGSAVPSQEPVCRTTYRCLWHLISSWDQHMMKRLSHVFQHREFILYLRYQARIPLRGLCNKMTNASIYEYAAQKPAHHCAHRFQSQTNRELQETRRRCYTRD
ncbi:hypothetical protein GGI43DRAFT_392444 [Trichoderma evansii]